MEEEPKVEASSEGEARTMTFEEYAEMNHNTPYVFEVEDGEKKIVYFGAGHSRNPEDPMFRELEQKFQDADPQMVFVEGMNGLEERKEQGIPKLKETDRNEVIKELGEPGFVLKLTAEAGIDMESPEPRFSDEIDHLLTQGFDRDEILAFYMYRQIDQYHHTPEKARMEEYLEPYLQEFHEATQWEGFDYSLRHLEEVGRTIWGDGGGLGSIEGAKERIDPTPWPEAKDKQTVVNEIARQSSYYRDRYVVSRIKEAMKGRDRLFVVFGASHAVMQEPAIRELLSKKA